ncbi:PAAR-like protein [Enterocloster citroniae]
MKTSEEFKFNFKDNTVTAGAFTFEMDGWKVFNLLKWCLLKSSYDTYEEQAAELMCRHYEFYEQMVNDTEYVTRESELWCDKGSERMYMDAYEDHGIIAPNGRPLMTCEDCKVGVNIIGFGDCSVEESKYSELGHHPTWTGSTHECFPVLEETWKQDNVENTVRISNLKGEEFVDALRAGAYLTCIYGGVIANNYDWAMPEELKGNVSKKGDLPKNCREATGILEADLTINNLYIDSEERYWVAVGPNVMNQNHDKNSKITVEEMHYGTKLDIVVFDENTGTKYYIPAVVGDVKEHSKPDGLYQTGIPFDESRPTVEGDGSTVEFLGYEILLKDGKSSVNVTNNYKLIELVVYDGV